YGDGAGAVVLGATESEEPTGILAHSSRSDTIAHSKMLSMGPSYAPEHEEEADIFLKMNGRKLYQYALETVPAAVKACLEKSRISLDRIAKFLFHQANGKMDSAILERLFSLYGKEESPEGIMPMIVPWAGNSSVASLPTLLDLILRGRMEGQQIEKGDPLVLASVGAGMNINAMIYKT
ncbi:MAG: 3-oxoacyl-ACP synthase III family protein, partial [Flavobacteriales bacterium]